MKKNNFNKFGGTEFRTKKQIAVYASLIGYIKEEPNIDNKLFKKWCIEQDLSVFNKYDKIDRFKMILPNITKDIEICKKLGNGKIIIDEKYDCENIEQSFMYFMANSKSDCSKAFKKFLLVIQNNNNISAKNVFHAFAVFENGDDFDKLCEIDVLSELSKNALKNGNIYKDKFEKFYRFRKPPYALKYINKIINKKQKKEKITNADFTDYIPNRDKFIKKIFIDKINLQVLINKINLICLEDLFFKLIYQCYKNNLDGDYYDLFNRFMIDLKLCDRLDPDKYTLKKWNIKEYKLLEDKKVNKTYPYSEEEVNSYLKDINKNCFSFKHKDEKIKNVPNFALAEYFTNLKFAYLLDIEVSKFRNFCLTNVDSDLIPYFSAPGDDCDMYYIKNETLYIFETTILKNKREIINHESYPIIKHSISHHKIGVKYLKLFLISFDLNDDEFEIKSWIDNALKWEKINIFNNHEFKKINFEKISKDLL